MSQAAPIAIDTGRQFFVDDFLVERTTLHRTFHKPKVDPRSPVLKPETAMEMNRGVNPCSTMASVVYDPKDGLYKAWYMAGWDDGFGYATSEDGITWTRPDLDVVPGTHRVLPPFPGYIRHNASVSLDHEAKDPAERFKMYAFYRIGTGSWPRKDPDPKPSPAEVSFIYTSPDGIHWTKRAQTGPTGDTTSMYRDPFRGTWVYSIRLFRGVLGRWRSFYESADFVQGGSWKKEDAKPWLATDALDRPDPVLQLRPELYKHDAVAYESLMVGLFGIYYGPPNHVVWEENIPKTLDLHIGFSRDGVNWDRPDRTAFIPCSRRFGAWDNAYLQSSGGICLIVGDELRFYFGAFSGVSPERGKGTPAGGSTGFAVLRRDGFASMDGPGMQMPPINATGDRTAFKPEDMLPPGMLTTKAVQFSGKHLFVNARVAGGDSLRVEVLDAESKAVKGFSVDDCIPVTGDSTKHAVKWRGGQDLSALAGKPVKFRFILNAGELYAFWVAKDASGASGGYVAAGGPGFKGSKDI